MAEPVFALTLCVSFHQDIITKMLHVDPHQRLTAPQVGHQFSTFYAQLKIQVPEVPFTANAFQQVFTKTKTKKQTKKKHEGNN